MIGPYYEKPAGNTKNVLDIYAKKLQKISCTKIHR